MLSSATCCSRFSVLASRCPPPPRSGRCATRPDSAVRRFANGEPSRRDLAVALRAKAGVFRFRGGIGPPRRLSVYSDRTMTSANRRPIGLSEFVALMATLTALAALSIDMVLPALPAIGASLGVERANDNQLVVSLLFLGFGVGQLF